MVRLGQRVAVGMAFGWMDAGLALGTRDFRPAVLSPRWQAPRSSMDTALHRMNMW